MSLTSQYDTKYDPSDKRYLPRWEVQNRVFYRLEKDPQTREGATKDISCSGARITTPTSLIPYQKIQLTIRLAEETFISVNGHIIWVKCSALENEVGISFLNTSAQIQEVILQNVFELNREKFQNHWFKGWEEKK